MKCSSLLPQVALVFAVAYACTDSAAPARSHSLLAPTGVDGVIGKVPPPPVSTVIAVEIQSPGTAVFTGVFFNNGLIHDDGLGSTETLDGTAWLRFDNNNMQPDVGGWSGTTSANARFMAKDMDFSGHGTLFIEGIAYKIVSVEDFTRFAGCGDPEFPRRACASIQFTAVVEGEVCDPDTGVGCHTGRALVFDRSECLVGYEGKEEQFYQCRFPNDD